MVYVALQVLLCLQKTQRVQQFDMLFTTLLSELIRLSDNFFEKDYIDSCYKIFSNNYKLEYKQVDLRKEYQLTRFFILLYQILKNISENNFLNDKEKKKYSNIIRASLDNTLLQLLMLNCNCAGFNDDFKEYRKFVEEFSLFEHMDFFDLRQSEFYSLNFDLLLCVRNYKKQAFGNSIYLDKVISTWYYSIAHKNISTVSKYQFF